MGVDLGKGDISQIEKDVPVDDQVVIIEDL